MDKKQYTLFELNENIKQSLHSSFPEPLWVVAEINDISINRNGHCYLELVEKGENENIKAKSRAIIWAYTFRMLQPYFEQTTGQKLEAGLKVLVNGMVEFHELYGLSINIRDIDPNYTLGDLARQKLITLKKLQDEGVMEMNKEIALPEVIQKIAVISSETAAGYGDFMNQVLNNSHGYKFYVKLFPAVMQGNEAEKSIASALESIFEYEDFFDAVVIIRGGGAKSDLNCFNGYWLNFHVTQFPLPVLSGIGHERDETVLDMIANTRLKTPTAVAEFLIDHNHLFESRLNEYQNIFIQKVQRFMQLENDRQLTLNNHFKSFVRFSLSKKEEELNRLMEKTTFNTENYLSRQKERLIHQYKLIPSLAKNHLFKLKNETEQIPAKMKSALNYYIKNQQNKMAQYENTLTYVDPKHIIGKGYSLTLKNGKIIKDINELSKDDQIETRLRNGKLLSKLEEKAGY